MIKRIKYHCENMLKLFEPLICNSFFFVILQHYE